MQSKPVTLAPFILNFRELSQHSLFWCVVEEVQTVCLNALNSGVQ